MKQICQRLSTAYKKKKWPQKIDAEDRIKWLKELTKEAQKDHPDTEWEKILAQIIAATKARQVNLKLSGMMKGEQAALDYIEVPNEKWYYNEETKELYEFNDGLFCAHPCIDKTKQYVSTSSVLKKLPDEAKVVDVRKADNKLVLDNLWYYNKRLKEVYLFQDGEISAHAQVDADEKRI